MKLKETDWDAPGGAAEYLYDYPEAPIAEFVDWIRKTSAWLENPELVHRQLRRLNGVLSDWRDRHKVVTVTADVGANTVLAYAEATRDTLITELEVTRAAEIKAKRQANMAKAQAALKAKREVQRAGQI